jgi:hypothetical protein
VEKFGRARKARDDNKTGRMRFACWMNKTTHTHVQNIQHFLLFHKQMFSRTRLNITFICRLPVFLNAREVVYIYTCTCHSVSFLSTLGIWPDWQRCHVMIPVLQNKTSLPGRHCSTLDFSSLRDTAVGFFKELQIILIF